MSPFFSPMTYIISKPNQWSHLPSPAATPLPSIPLPVRELSILLLKPVSVLPQGQGQHIAQHLGSAPLASTAHRASIISYHPPTPLCQQHGERADAIYSSISLWSKEQIHVQFWKNRDRCLQLEQRAHMLAHLYRRICFLNSEFSYNATYYVRVISWPSSMAQESCVFDRIQETMQEIYKSSIKSQSLYWLAATLKLPFKKRNHISTIFSPSLFPVENIQKLLTKCACPGIGK